MSRFSCTQTGDVPFLLLLGSVLRKISTRLMSTVWDVGQGDGLLRYFFNNIDGLVLDVLAFY